MKQGEVFHYRSCDISESSQSCDVTDSLMENLYPFTSLCKYLCVGGLRVYASLSDREGKEEEKNSNTHKALHDLLY